MRFVYGNRELPGNMASARLKVIRIIWKIYLNQILHFHILLESVASGMVMKGYSCFQISSL